MSKATKPRYGSKFRTLDLSKHFNWPRQTPKETWWQNTAKTVKSYPKGQQKSWGIPFALAGPKGPCVIRATKGKADITVPVGGKATYVCFAHHYIQTPETLHWEAPMEGLVVGEYEFVYADRTRHVQPVRARFEINLHESPGPTWKAVAWDMYLAIDPAAPVGKEPWGREQMGLNFDSYMKGARPIMCPVENPHPEKTITSVTIRCFQESPLFVAGITLYQGTGHPLVHLPRRTYRLKTASGKPARVEKAEVDLGAVTDIVRAHPAPGAAWLKSPVGTTPNALVPQRGLKPEGEDLIQVAAADDATLSVTLADRKTPLTFSMGEAYHAGKSRSGGAQLEVVGKQRQWMQVTVVDSSTGQPTPTRVHFVGPRGEYIAPYGHHEQVNPNWFEDYGADVIVGDRSYAYVAGQFTTDLPVGDVYVEINKGFEYQPVRTKISIRPGQKELKLRIDRWRDLRKSGWVTADTHVHFVSPHTAWLEAQCEGVNIVNLLASQWGRLFTNVGDITGKPNVVENDTIVYVGTENRNHMLGHMSMLGTQGLPVYPMCCGGPTESFIGDPDFRMMAEWALENKRKRGVVIRPHYPHCGHTEDPVPILKGLVDALEVRGLRGGQFELQEWYRYLNCGYKVAVCGGTDKMGAMTPIGWYRTYAKLDPNKKFTYGAWAQAMREGRCFATTGPVIDLAVDGHGIGDTIEVGAGGATLEFHATAECFAPLEVLEVVFNGKVVARAKAAGGAKKLVIRDKVRIAGSGWLAARCASKLGGVATHLAAHTSPVYVKVPGSRAFDGPAAEHMLALVEGGIEYMNTLATVFDEPSRKRMVKLFNEARQELRGRLVVEAQHTHHHGTEPYHTHGHGEHADHEH